MDWSLVLTSQGIETTIECLPETGQWCLLVAEADLEGARESIRLYRQENRNRRWQRELEFTGLLFDWRCLFWAFYLSAMFYFSEVLPADLKAAGLMDAAAVQAGQWWRLFTATTLHADVGHLATNLSTGLILVGLAMGAYGAGAALLAVLLAGVCGNLLAYWLLGPSHRSLGASGMVMGALGLLSVYSVAFRGHWAAAKLIGRGLLAGVLLLVLLGLNPGSDVLAHLGGFIGGSLAGLILTILPAHWLRSPWDGVLAGLSGWLIVLSWIMALSQISRW
jgi:membrane associated rhomboid family serine protease